MTKICKLTLDVYTFPSPYRFELPQKGLTWSWFKPNRSVNKAWHWQNVNFTTIALRKRQPLKVSKKKPRIEQNHHPRRLLYHTTRYQHKHGVVEGFMGQTLTRMTTSTMVTWAGHNAGCGLTSDTPGSRPIPVYTGQAVALCEGAQRGTAQPTCNANTRRRAARWASLEFHRSGNTTTR